MTKPSLTRILWFSICFWFVPGMMIHGDEVRELRVMCWNIHHGEGVDDRLDLERIAAVIRSVKPDIVALQEVEHRTKRTQQVDQAAELAKLTGMTHLFGKNIDFQGGGYGNAILSRYPMRLVENVSLPNVDNGEQRGVLIAKIELSEKQHLTFFCTHLDHRFADEERKRSAKKIAELSEKYAGEPQILAGDLNATRASEVLKIFQETWEVTNKEEQPTIPVEQPTRQIDFILYPRGSKFRAVETRVLDERVASDHRPMFSVLEIVP